MTPLETLRYHVTGAIERGEATAIAGIPAPIDPSPADAPIILVPRVYPAKPDGHPECVLFLPHAAANPGRIVCYAHVGQHSEASTDYYSDTRPPADAPIIERQRLPAGWRSIAWAATPAADDTRGEFDYGGERTC